MGKAKLVGVTMTVDVDAIEANPWNPNVQSNFQYEKERTSIREFGFIDPITVRTGREIGPAFKRMQVIDGEHRLKAAIAEGLTQVTVHNIGRISDARAKVLTDMLNRLRGDNDSVKWAEMIDSVFAEDEKLIDLLPYKRSDIDSMLAAAHVDPLDDDAAEPRPAKAQRLYKKFTVSLPEQTLNQAKDLMRRIKALRKMDDDATAFKALLDLATEAMAAKRQTPSPVIPIRRKRSA